MKICVISTTVIVCPPPGYAGLEQLAWQQADGLAKRGHKVLLVAPNGSKAPDGVELHGTTLMEPEMKAYSGYWQRLPEYDAIIDNSWQKWAYLLKVEGKLKAPVLGVCHAPIHTMFQTPPPVQFPCLIAISKDQAEGISQHLGVPARVAYNGIDLDFYKPMPEIQKTDRYLFLARMSTIKGPHIAIDIARQTRIGLDMVGDDTITAEPGYASRIKELSVNNIKYIGPQSRAECVNWFNRNKCLLHTAKFFREPFGLAPVEAQACGMPVIAFDNGAMRETVKHGVTGFIVKDEKEIVDLIKSDAARSIKPNDCRSWAGQFSVSNMIDSYEKLCKEAIEQGW